MPPDDMAMTVSILLQMGICALFGLVLVRVAGVDPLTAYRATSPGGADPAAIIAAGWVDGPFVMALQTARFLSARIDVVTVPKALTEAKPLEPFGSGVSLER